MKRFISTVLIGLGFCSVALAGPSPIWALYGGSNTNTPTIDAVIFYNAGFFDTFTGVTISNLNANLIGGISAIPFSTSDTLYYTNTSSGTIEGTPGFRFDTRTSTTRRSASSFVNDGVVTAFDVEAFPELFVNPGATAYLPDVNDSQPLPSQLQIFCTNILNDGTMSVGNYGLMQMAGSNISTANGVLVAGAVNTGSGFGVDPLDATSGSGLLFENVSFYVNPAGVYDLFWGVTNGAKLALDTFSPPETTIIEANARGGVHDFISLPLNGNTEFASFVYSNNFDGTNTYFTIVFVNTNFTDVDGQPNSNITASVEFGFDDFASETAQAGDINANIAMVQFATPVQDVITGQVVTNAVYLLDDGANFATMSNYDNASEVNGYSRPNAFVVTTETPFIWEQPPFAIESNFVYSPTLIYAPNTYSDKSVTFEAAEYGVQIGRNPSQVDGNFNFETSLALFGTNFVGTNFISEFFGLGNGITLPDPTNEPARIELTANQLDLSNSRLRAEGMVTINASNIIGNPAGSDWGEINAQIGAANGSLVISNFFPTNFQRLRGDIYAWSGNWVNTITNIGTNSVTNTYHYHVLVVDQNLGGNFQSAIRNLSLTGTNAITTQDSLYVINQSSFNTSNLTFNGNATFTQNAGNLGAANMPKLKYFLNNTNANLSVDGLFDVGFDVTKLPTSPAGRKYTVTSVTNLGTVTATSPVFQSQFFENDGTITADNNGSMIIEAASLGLGLALPNTNNLLQADENITLSANAIGAVNSQIVAGGVFATGRGQLTLQTTANGEITDFASGEPSTNASLVNFWQVSDGFSLPVKPATGDLFGTEITTVAMGYTVALHTWAGVDLGPSATGFADNMVIGHLTLSRGANGVLHFTGAGAKNAMYVDYLELDLNSAFGTPTGYREGLVIDPNITIYFAACNFDPIKLETVYTNRLIWVPGFAGPNSTVAVPYLGSTNVCLMNSSLATSHEISFFGSIPNGDNQPYVLNDPSNPTNIFPCPSDTTMFKDFVIGTSISNDVNVGISTTGEGTISPDIKRSQIALGKKYALTATPAKGWTFAGWSARGLPEGVDTTSRVLKFTIENNLMLTANFTPQPFTQVKGVYYGLFTNSSPAADNSGWFTFTLSQNGALSGRLLIGTSNYTFSSTFPTNGSTQVTAKHGSQSLTVTLNLNLADPGGHVVGNVTDGTWSSPLLGYMAPATWTTKTPSPYAGQYTMFFTNGVTNVTTGDSYGSVIISKPGVLSVGGRLADGEAFNQTVPISKDGLWPFYTYVAKGEDCLFGWIAFQDDLIHGVTMDETNLFWSKGPSSKDGYYPAGFTSAFNLTGSPYAFPGRHSSGLALADPIVVLSGGGLDSALTDPVVYDGKLTYASSNLTLTINPGMGTFTGRFQNSADGPSLKLSGVVLQNQGGAFGFFPGADNESGAVQLQGQ